MSEIKSFSDYTSKYNSNVDFSALFSGTSDSSSVGNTNMLSDYAAIKNGSYGKLMKAYYAKQDAEKLSGKGDTSQKLTLMFCKQNIAESNWYIECCKPGECNLYK